MSKVRRHLRSFKKKKDKGRANENSKYYLKINHDTQAVGLTDSLTCMPRILLF